MDAVTPWLATCVILFFTTFLQEDLAIISGGFLTVNQGMPVSLVLVVLFLGVVSGDCFIYFLGMVAHQVPWARRRVIGPKVDRLREKLDRHAGIVVFACRVLPGILFSAYVACGWFRVPFRRFLFSVVASATIYVPLATLAVVKFGELTLHRMGWTSWLLILAVAWWFILRRVFQPAISRSLVTPDGAVALASLPGGGGAMTATSFQKESWSPASFRGGSAEIATVPPPSDMPPAPEKPSLSLAERIPPIVFYTPVVFAWLGLALRYRSFTLPTVTNPGIFMGGLWGESKSELLSSIGTEFDEWVAPFVTIRTLPGDGDDPSDARDHDHSNALSAMVKKGLEFPVVAKPDIGWQGYGVQLIPTAEALREYLLDYPGEELLILQQSISWEGEAGIFYARSPGETSGRIVSLTFRHFPSVVGDGFRTVGELIAADSRTRFRSKASQDSAPRHQLPDDVRIDSVPAPGERIRLSFIGSLRVGGLYRDGRSSITPKLTQRIDAIAQSMPEFYFGRFDLRFESVQSLEAGEKFSIFEVNGAGSEAIHIWDPELSIFAVYADLLSVQNLMFKIASQNRRRGFRPIGLRSMLRHTRSYDGLLVRYPPSN